MYMDERFGAWQVGDDPNEGVVEFKVFIPDRGKDGSQYKESRVDKDGAAIPDFGDPKIESVQVAGDFQEVLSQTSWDFDAAPFMEKLPHPKGWVWTYRTAKKLPKGFYQYKYYVTFKNGEKRKVGDPCTRYGGSENQNSGIVVGGSRNNKVAPLSGERKHLRDLVLYELMIDDFTEEYRRDRAPLDAVVDKLKYLKEQLGISAILFLPWTAWPGEGFNWGYNPYQYFAVEYRYANAMNEPEEKLSRLKNLISECHGRGIHVIMDGVFNHVGDVDPDTKSGTANGFPYLWLYQDPKACPYVGKFGGEFTGLKDLDYNNGCVREFIRDVCYYWIDEFQIDGIRFDNAVNFYVQDQKEGLPTLLQDIKDHVDAKGLKNFSLTLEYIDDLAAKVTNETCATSYWNNEMYQRCFDYLWNRRIDSRIMRALITNAGLNDDKVPTIYIGNHDHSHVAWQAGARDNAGALQWYRTQPYAIALFTSPGAVMIQNGQEFGEDHWVMEDDHCTNRRVKPRPLRWDFVNDPIGGSLMDVVYVNLIRIRNAHPGLRSNNIYPGQWEEWQTKPDPQGYGVDVDKGVVIYHRWGNAVDGKLERFIVVLNFSDNLQTVDIPFSVNGAWDELLSGGPPVTVENFSLPGQRVESNWGRIYYNKE